MNAEATVNAARQKNEQQPHFIQTKLPVHLIVQICQETSRARKKLALRDDKQLSRLPLYRR